MRPRYRVQQFLAKLRRQHPIDEAALTAYLSSAQIALFQSIPVSEQRHAFDVMRALQEQGHSEAALAQAALLHDVGKTEGPVHLWHRVTTVLLLAIHPALLRRLAVDEPGSWRYPFFVLLHHAARGAAAATEAGTDSLAAALIYWHHTIPEESDLDPEGRELLAALRSADEQI